MSEYIKKDYNDLIIIPSSFSTIRSRKEILPYYEHNMGFHLPLITAPMDTVVDETNYHAFINNRINICYPRGVKSSSPKMVTGCMEFESVSLTEFESIIAEKNKSDFSNPYYVCIDIANGHMQYLHDLIKVAKGKFGESIVIMAGNIDNPETYKILSNSGADFVRVGIGNGGGCTTTANAAIGYPMASLIRECREISYISKTPAKIIADGGIKSYSDVLKALALGADYVQIGSLFNKSLESCGDTYFKGIKLNPQGKIAEWLFDNGFTLNKKFRGMSTKEVQKKWGKDEFTTSEGVIRIRKVEYKLDKWIENFTDYLRSNMSYCNSKCLKDYIGNVQVIEISQQAFQRFNK